MQAWVLPRRTPRTRECTKVNESTQTQNHEYHEEEDTFAKIDLSCRCSMVRPVSVMDNGAVVWRWGRRRCQNCVNYWIWCGVTRLKRVMTEVLDYVSE